MIATLQDGDFPITSGVELKTFLDIWGYNIYIYRILSKAILTGQLNINLLLGGGIVYQAAF